MSLAYFKTSVGGYFFDVTYSENHALENAITENPVQSGASINDHVYQQPRQLTLDVGVSDCLTSYASGQFTNSSTRAISAYQVLVGLWKTAQVMQIATPFETYPSMVLKSINMNCTAQTMNAMRATVTFQEVIIVNAVNVGISSEQQVTGSGGGGGRHMMRYD